MTILVETLVLLAFLSKFFKAKYNIMLLSLIWSVLQLLRQVLFTQQPILTFLIGFSLDYILLIYLYKKDIIYKKLFTLLLFYIFSFIFDTFVVCLYIFIFKDVLYIDNIVILGILSKVILLIFITKFKNYLYQEKSFIKWIYLYSLPILCIFILIITFPYMTQALNLMITKLIGIISFLSLILNILLIRLLSKKAIIEKQRTDLATIEKIKNANTENFIKLRNHYRETERLAHDIKKHLSFIYYLNNLEETKSYISTLISKNFTLVKIYTGNFDIDTILSIYKDEIKINCSGNIPNSITWLNSVDLNTILSNIIENASKHSDYIKFNFIYSDNWIIISSKNYTSQDIECIAKGIGTVNIEETIKKYDGNLIYKIENNIFYTDVLLQKK